ncbi:hypothetical protein, partial [Streptomyces sp. AS02]|uniref:hypothetical protein n=1 Tax=Streptomyces sp. AS02 TaxID=2938946 RepID=UPI00202185C2
ELLMDNNPAMAFIQNSGAEKNVENSAPAAQNMALAANTKPSMFNRLFGFVKAMFNNKDIQAPAATSAVLTVAGH